LMTTEGGLVVERSAATRCTGCGDPVEDCAVCNAEQCPAVICYGCLAAELAGMPEPHGHGG
jgi:hypothetical protein